LAEAGARHPDLNLKNVLLATDANGRIEAWVIDVDRVWFDAPGAPEVAAANVRRLARSAEKWRARHGLAITAEEIRALAPAVAR
ncbi:MAG TPA: lipopolysaccharide kinase InaA family protein, partial [Gemmatimonadaceae bacterium]|nr:lipopolysaccharide kinase InaA family protein [Gemmatimonadaceae bacterium]